MQRKLASNSFRVRDIRRSLGVFSNVADQCRKLLSSLNGTPFDIQTLMSNVTLAAFSELAFGRRLATVDLEQSEFAQNFNKLTEIFVLRLSNPFWSLMPWLPSERAARAAKRYIDNLADQVIADAEETLAKRGDDELNENLLVPFLTAEYDKSVIRDRQQFLRDVLASFLVAGRDTTGVALTMFFYLMATHADRQARLHAEICQYYDGADGDVEWALVEGKLPFLSACLKETLRLYPPVPIDPKYALHNDVLPSGVPIHSGMIVEWQQWTLSRNPALWPRPNDFVPERWLAETPFSSSVAPPTQNTPPWCPFQFGPRTCLGVRMATVDMEAVIVKLVRTFEFAPSPRHAPPKMNTFVTLFSLNGVHVTAKPR